MLRLADTRGTAFALGLLLGWSWLAPAEAAGQARYASPEIAANTLVIAVAKKDEVAMQRLLGDDFRALLPLQDMQAADLDRFLNAWIRFNAVVPLAADRRALVVGEQGWQLPIPIVRDGAGWRFDTANGGALMRTRRIGRNELSAMRAALAYRAAQIDYARQDRDGDGVLEFAQRFISSPGKRDGLYWERQPGDAPAPLASPIPGTLPGGDDLGYRFRILTAQGNQAPEGAHDYIVDGDMRRGFGLIAWPVDYGASGVMSFMLGRDGELYQADLGPDSAAIAAAIPGYDPDGRWQPVSRDFTGF